MKNNKDTQKQDATTEEVSNSFKERASHATSGQEESLPEDGVKNKSGESPEINNETQSVINNKDSESNKSLEEDQELQDHSTKEAAAEKKMD